MTQHRAGVNEGFLTKHKLKLTDLNHVNAQEIEIELDTLVGVDGCSTLDLAHSIKKVQHYASPCPGSVG